MTEIEELKKWGCTHPEKYDECDFTICEDCKIQCQYCGGRADTVCEQCSIPIDAECDCGTDDYIICPKCSGEPTPYLAEHL